MLGLVCAAMSDCLRAGKPSRHVINHLDHLSLPSLQVRYIKYMPVWLGLKWGAFTCQVASNTVIDLI